MTTKITIIQPSLINSLSKFIFDFRNKNLEVVRRDAYKLIEEKINLDENQKNAYKIMIDSFVLKYQESDDKDELVLMQDEVMNVLN